MITGLGADENHSPVCIASGSIQDFLVLLFSVSLYVTEFRSTVYTSFIVDMDRNTSCKLTECPKLIIALFCWFVTLIFTIFTLFSTVEHAYFRCPWTTAKHFHSPLLINY